MPPAPGSIRARISGSLKSRFGRWRLGQSSRVGNFAPDSDPSSFAETAPRTNQPNLRKDSPTSSFTASLSSDSTVSSPDALSLGKRQGTPPTPTPLSLEQPPGTATSRTSSGMFTLNLEGGATYKGGISISGLQHGYGRLLYSNGAEYKGEWVDGFKHGMGVTNFSDGTKHVGAYRHGVIQGKGTMTWPNGSKYFGNFEDGLPHGYGSQISADLEFYHGDWEQGRRVNGSVLAQDGKISHRLISANEQRFSTPSPRIADRMVSSVTEMESPSKRLSPIAHKKVLKRTPSSRSPDNPLVRERRGEMLRL